MIELRWLEVEMVNAKIGVFTDRKLQYRFQAPYAAANGNLMWPLEPNWTEWTDVPFSSGDQEPK